MDEGLSSRVWHPVNESYRFYAQCSLVNPKHLLAAGRELIASLPPGSVYISGSDPGRFVVTALCRDDIAGDPIMVTTLSQLSDSLYLGYLRSMYGNKMNLPMFEDSQQVFRDYLADAQRRLEEHRLKPGEKVSKDANGLTQVQGPAAVWEINGLTARILFEKNPSLDFFIEQSVPSDWMYPHLSPAGLILRLNRESLLELSAATVASDRDDWTRRITPLIGDWLKEDTSVEEVCAFTGRVYARRDLAGFKGDPEFVQTAWPWHQAPEHIGASIFLGHSRAMIADLYFWRAFHSRTTEQRERMIRAADFAFRQALALCPYENETVSRYVRLLLSCGRFSDARLVTHIAALIKPDVFHELEAPTIPVDRASATRNK